MGTRSYGVSSYSPYVSTYGYGLRTLERGLLMLSLRLRLMLMLTTMETMAMVTLDTLPWDTPTLDTPPWDTLTLDTLPFPTPDPMESQAIAPMSAPMDMV